MHTPRQLIVCCDGTNNTLTAGSADTNVLMLYEYLREHAAPAGVERLMYYDPGVGTTDAAPPTGFTDMFQRSSERIRGLASGRGVYENITEAYLFLMQHWRDKNDRIYCFGFSRGAFTVRCVVGMVNLFGVLSMQHVAMLPTLIRIYFSLPSNKRGGAAQECARMLHKAMVDRNAKVLGASHGSQRETVAAQARMLFTQGEGGQAWVHWVGVWDTVESVGLPGPLARGNPSAANLGDKRIRHVRHALAFDEHRWAFEPRLYEEPGDVDDGERTLKQRWFPGVHCDVGGSYKPSESALSNDALAWMVNEMADDIGVPRMDFSQASDTQHVKHDALWTTPWWALAGMSLRNMQPHTTEGQPIAVIEGPASTTPLGSVWERRRSPWTFFFTLLIGCLFLLLAGTCLLPFGWKSYFVADGFGMGAAIDVWSWFWMSPLLYPTLPWSQLGQPAWALFWDLAATLMFGYVLARISSRSFTWLAGARGPQSTMPWWRWLGMAPLAAFGGAVCTDALMLVAIGAHGLGTDILGRAFLFCAAITAVVRTVGLLACVPLFAVRAWVAVAGQSANKNRTTATASANR